MVDVELLNRLVFDSTTSAYSPSIVLTDANAVLAEIVLIRGPSGFGVRCQAQQGNDGENWTPVGSAAAITTVGPTNYTVTGVGAYRLRLKFDSTGSAGQVVLGVALSTKKR